MNKSKYSQFFKIKLAQLALEEMGPSQLEKLFGVPSRANFQAEQPVSTRP